MQVELGFGNIAVDDVFFVPGYDIRGFVVAQVKYYIFYFLSECLFIYLFILKTNLFVRKDRMD